MQKTNYHSSEARGKLKLVGKAPAAKLHLGASAPPDDFQPDEYLAKCTGAWVEPYRGEWRIVWQFQICDGLHHGVGVRKWKTIDASGDVPLENEYARACVIALDRPLDENIDDLNDPASIFAGKKFIVFVGYRKTEKPKGGRASNELALTKKGSDDKLKVHEIRSLVRLSLISPISPMGLRCRLQMHLQMAPAPTGPRDATSQRTGQNSRAATRSRLELTGQRPPRTRPTAPGLRDEGPQLGGVGAQAGSPGA